jgi:hypothetical protein
MKAVTLAGGENMQVSSFSNLCVCTFDVTDMMNYNVGGEESPDKKQGDTE